MISLIRTDNTNPDFKKLVALLDKELLDTYGEAQAFYAPHNIIPEIIPTVIAYENDTPAGCGCYKNFDENSVEVKRMFTIDSHRGKGIAAKILSELEVWAKEQNFSSVVLETGNKQYAAIALYKKLGYEVTENYEPYIGKEESICMRKSL